MEITSINQKYLEINKLKLKILSRGFAWLDTGTHEALTEATEFVKVVENRTGLKIGCIEEIALNYNWISKAKLINNIRELKGVYYDYLKVDKAIENFSKAINFNPEYEKAYFSLAMVFKDLGRKEEFFKNIEKALHLNPNWGHAYFHLSRVKNFKE